MAFQRARTVAAPEISPLAGQAMARAVAHMETGDHRSAIASLLSIRQHIRKNDVASNTLAYLHLSVGDHEAAARWFETAIKCRPEYAEAWSGLGLVCHLLGRSEPALKAIDQALSLRPNHADDWYHRSLIVADMGQTTQAIENLDCAISIKPDYGLALSNRARLLEKNSQLAEALKDRERLCTLAPSDPNHWTELGNTYFRLGRNGEALACYQKALACDPRHAAAWTNRATVLKDSGRPEDARASILQALELNGDNTEAQILHGNIEQDLGNLDNARSIFAKLAEQGAVKTYPAAVNPARFHVLFVFSPMAGNTPYEYLIDGASFESRVLLFVPGCSYDNALLARGADLVVNLISDADCGLDVLGKAESLLNDLRLPIINPTYRVAKTDRQSISESLAKVDDCVMPLTKRFHRNQTMENAGQIEAIFTYPMIMRTPGTHGGDTMELVTSRADIENFFSAPLITDFYVTQFVDYRSADGYYRKYRFVFVGDQILPYHLAIGDGWKVHHATTRMAENQWMRAEELSFLANPHDVFPTRAMKALRNIKDLIGLDYFGIDCSLTADGRLIIFEVNASMLIHQRHDGFEYTIPYVARIKNEFENLLKSRVKTAC